MSIRMSENRPLPESRKDRVLLAEALEREFKNAPPRTALGLRQQRVSAIPGSDWHGGKRRGGETRYIIERERLVAMLQVRTCH